MFKIDPSDKTEVNQVKGSRLYLHGVKSNNIQNIISSGYSDELWSFDKKCKEDCFYCVKPQCARYASQSFSLEISKSIGKCENARNLKLKFLNQEFAYIFIVGAKEVDEKTITTKVDKDRRECYIKDGSFRIETDISLCVGIPSRKAVPAYLLIVEVTDELMLNLY